MQKHIKSILAVSAVSLALAGCVDEFEKTPQIEFNDTILRHSYTDTYGLATGLLNIYIVYGKYKLADKTIPAGICLTPQGFRKFRIRQLLDKYPTLAEFPAEEAARRQDFTK